MAVLRPLGWLLIITRRKGGRTLRRRTILRTLWQEREKYPFREPCISNRKIFWKILRKSSVWLPVAKCDCIYAYFITCVKAVKDEKTGRGIELHCNYDPKTLVDHPRMGAKSKATLHWVSAILARHRSRGACV